MLENYQPKKVFQYFEEICRIPHPSYHCEAISNYLMDFAKEHALEAYQDELHNVIIIKEAAKGKEDVEPIMIQGHMDMVAVKDDDCEKDLLKEGLDLAVDGDYLYAEKTSLGGDDGIAIAYGLALLSDDTLKLPRIELVITTEEEVGMEGATGIDLSVCKANRMLNLDTEEEGEFVVSCAGGVRVQAHMPFERVPVILTEDKALYHVEISKLTGGHSGTEIIHGRANAVKILGWVLKNIREEVSMELVKLAGGTKDNAIPVYADAVILASKQDFETLKKVEERLQDIFFHLHLKTDEQGRIDIHELTFDETRKYVQETNYENAECKNEIIEKGIENKNIEIGKGTEHINDEMQKKSVEYGDGKNQIDCIPNHAENGNTIFCIEEERAKDIIAFIYRAPNGVQAMSRRLEGLVETSLNLGIMECSKEAIRFVFSLRSSISQEKDALRRELCELIQKHGGSFELAGEYPAWEYKEKSDLREHMKKIYQKQYGKAPKVLSIHAGLECGILAAKKPGLDCVACGPDILDIHTTRERLSISSVERVWKFIVEVLETL